MKKTNIKNILKLKVENTEGYSGFVFFIISNSFSAGIPK